MLSKFSSVVNFAISSKKAEIAKDSNMYGYEKRLKDIERRLDNGAIDIAGAMAELRDCFRGEMYLKSWEYGKIEKDLGYNLK